MRCNLERAVAGGDGFAGCISALHGPRLRGTHSNGQRARRSDNDGDDAHRSSSPFAMLSTDSLTLPKWQVGFHPILQIKKLRLTEGK